MQGKGWKGIGNDGVDENDDDHFPDLPRNAGHNVGGEEVAAPERLLALHES